MVKPVLVGHHRERLGGHPRGDQNQLFAVQLKVMAAGARRVGRKLQPGENKRLVVKLKRQIDLFHQMGEWSILGQADRFGHAGTPCALPQPC